MLVKYDLDNVISPLHNSSDFSETIPKFSGKPKACDLAGTDFFSFISNHLFPPQLPHSPDQMYLME